MSQNTETSLQSTPAEQSVLGSLMNFPDRFHAIAEILNADDFATPAHAALFSAMARQVKAGRPLDSVALLDAVNGKVDPAYIMELERNGYARENLKDHARIVRDHSLRRAMARYAQDLSKAANGSEGVDSLIAKANQGLSAVSTRLNTGTSISSYRDMMSGYLQVLKDRAVKGTGVTGLATGLDELDKMTTGFHDEELILLAARPSMGKTALAMNMAESTLLRGDRVMVFSMEMPAEQILQRSFSSIGRINQNSLKTGLLTEDELARLEAAQPILDEFDILIDDTPALSMPALSARAHEAHRERPIRLLVVDYVQLMTTQAGTNRTEGVGEISRAMKSLAKELKCPIILLSQLNRDLEKRPNKRPINSDLRDSGSLEQDADIILFVYRDEYYNEDSPDKGLAELIVGKQRNGPIGTVIARFLGPFSRFENNVDDAVYDRALARASADGTASQGVSAVETVPIPPPPPLAVNQDNPDEDIPF